VGKSNKKALKIMIVTLTVFLVGISLYLNQQQSKIQQAYNIQVSNNSDLKNRIKRSQELLDQHTYTEAINNPNKHIQMNVRQVKATYDVTIITYKLFEILLTYVSSNAYNARKRKVKNYTSNDVIEDKNLFQSDLINGSHYVDDSGLTCQFKQAHIFAGLLQDDNLPVIINARYISGFKGENKSLSNDIYVGMYKIPLKRDLLVLHCWIIYFEVMKVWIVVIDFIILFLIIKYML
jgi:hypothetical protein